MDRILGQDRAIEVLQSALRSGRLHHAYIFHGPGGVGKFTTAVAMARVLLCYDAQTDLSGRIAACGSCESCRLLRDAGAPPGAGGGGAHPDLHIVTKELARYSEDRAIRERKLTSIPVEVLRSALIEPVYLAAQQGHHKVFIVDEAELMNPAGQNALLKTLEEPPAGTFLFLVTSHEDRLLPTVRSRCQRVPFAPLRDELVGQWLTDHAGDLPDAQRDWLIGFAAGSLGAAQLAIDFSLFDWARHVHDSFEAMGRKQYPTQFGAQLAGLIDDFAKQWVDQHDNASKDAANRRGAALMRAIIAQHAQRQLRAAAQRCDVGDPLAAEQVTEPWLGVIDALQTAQYEVDRNVNLGLVMDHLVSLLYRALSGRQEAGVS